MSELLEKIAHCVEFGKVDKNAPYPPDMKGQDGADELTQQGLKEGLSADDILQKGLVVGMDKVGQKFSEKKVFIPQMLIAAKAMNAALVHLKPYFQSGEVQRKGKVILGTVTGDLHDIGKNLVAMAFEGAGWEVIDLGTDVNADKFLNALEENPEAAVGMSALLTTTMSHMQPIIERIREKYKDNKILVGGAPLSADYASSIGADFYSPDPKGAVAFLS